MDEVGNDNEIPSPIIHMVKLVLTEPPEFIAVTLYDELFPTNNGTPDILPVVLLNSNPIGNSVGSILKLATIPPLSVGLILTEESLGIIYDPLPYDIIGKGSLIVKENGIFLVAPLLLTLNWNCVVVIFTLGIPYIVPLESPRCIPSGNSGTTVQFTILPSIRLGTIGLIS